jgi:sugar lactone lactonase YvrE
MLTFGLFHPRELYFAPRYMKIAKSWAIATLLLAMLSVRPVFGATAESKASIPAHAAIFVAAYEHVNAYPATGRGNVPPIALDTDMVAPSALARDASGWLYVTNAATNTITIYASNANGNVPPIAVIGGSNTGLENPEAIALDASGKIYIVSTPKYPRGFIAVYPPLGNNTGILNEAPIAVIAGPKTLLKSPNGIALDAKGNLYVANALGGPVVRHEPADRGRITVYAAGSNGNVAPIAIISGEATGLAFPSAITLDPNGDIYVANAETANTKHYLPSITVYAAGSTGNAPPVATITGSNTGLIYSSKIALDSSGNLYAIGFASSAYSVNVYAPGSNGNVSPAASITGTATQLTGPIGFVLDSAGNLCVLNYNGGPTGGGSIRVYAMGSSGDIPPIATITSNFIGLGFASGIALDSGGNIYVADELDGVGTAGGIAIYPVGSYAVVPPAATIAGDHTGLANPLGIALDSTDNLAVLNSNNVITEYPAGSTGDATPNASITIDSKGKTSPAGIALGASGKVYVASQAVVNCNRQSCYETGEAKVAIFGAGSDGNAKPSAVIRGRNTSLSWPSAIAVGRLGDIYVANEGPMNCRPGCSCVPTGHGSITIYGPSSNGDITPTRTISGEHTKLSEPLGIALDSKSNIYVLNATGFGEVCFRIIYNPSPAADVLSNVAASGTNGIRGPILIFAAGSSGDVAPIGAIGGPLTGLNFFPAGIAVGPTGP